MPKPRVLLIEDDFDVSEMLNIYFSSQGFEIFNAHMGRDGIQMARAKSPNLILLDLMLPDMDGFSVCKALRTATLTRFIPIIFLTQRDRRADKVAGLELGADDYITKPFDIEELKLRVQGSLRRAMRDSLTDPRTGLPREPLLRDAEAAILAKGVCWRLNVSVSGLDSFRDQYGFIAADELLSFIGHKIVETISTYGTSEDFAAMRDDSHYVIITRSEASERFANNLALLLQDGARKYYNFTDLTRGEAPVGKRATDAPLMPLTVHVTRSPMGTAAPSAESTSSEANSTGSSPASVG